MRILLTGLLVWSIWCISTADAAEVKELIEKLQSKDSDVRRAAAKELAELGSEASGAVPELTRALRDRDLFVRRFAAEALGKIGPNAKSSIPELTLALNDERKEVQLAAIDALGQMGSASTQALTAALRDPNKDPAVRRKAAVGLGKIGGEARGAVPVMSDILLGKIKMTKETRRKGNDDDIRVEVATALGRIAKPEDKVAINALKAVSEGKQRNRMLQKAAADSLRRLTGSAPERKKK